MIKFKNREQIQRLAVEKIHQNKNLLSSITFILL